MKGVTQALHLEYGSTQSIVVLITDIVPHGFLLIQARAASSGSSLSVNAHSVARLEPPKFGGGG